MQAEAFKNDFVNQNTKTITRLTARQAHNPKLIGHNKYRALKSFDLENMDESGLEEFTRRFRMPVATALKQIAAYEAVYIAPHAKKSKEYLDKIKNQPAHQPAQLTKEVLWQKFVKAFFENEGRKFVQTPVTLENVKPLFFYFLGDFVNFKKCKNLSAVSQPGLQKGLLVVGDFGCGKSAAFWAFEKALKNVKGANFKGFTANEVVSDFERCKNTADKDFFYDTMFNGTRYFDDVKTERTANNYGKADLMKDILETRNRNRVKTYITCNYAPGKPGDVQAALLEFKTRYGDRVHDRLFQDFNIIEFKGESFRK